GFRGTVHFTTGDGLGTVPGDYTFAAADAGAHAFPSGATLKTAGVQTITATAGLVTGSAPVTVTPAAASRFAVAAPAASTAGTASAATVTALDPYGNQALTYAGTVHFGSSDPQATVPADHTFAPAELGSHTFVGGVTLRTAGSQTVTARDTTDGSRTGSAAVA